MSCDQVILIIVGVFCFFYGALISYFTIGWFSLKEFNNSVNTDYIKVSVIVPRYVASDAFEIGNSKVNSIFCVFFTDSSS